MANLFRIPDRDELFWAVINLFLVMADAPEDMGYFPDVLHQLMSTQIQDPTKEPKQQQLALREIPPRVATRFYVQYTNRIFTILGTAHMGGLALHQGAYTTPLVYLRSIPHLKFHQLLAESYNLYQLTWNEDQAHHSVVVSPLPTMFYRSNPRLEPAIAKLSAVLTDDSYQLIRPEYRLPSYNPVD